jgi:hypothetical protein
VTKKDEIQIVGRIEFDPENKTKKHEAQDSWKKIAMVVFDGDICEYYAWFLRKRFRIIINKPLRGPHVSFINDSHRDLSLNNTRSVEEIEHLWKITKEKWHNKEIPISLYISPRTNSEYWWLNVTDESRSDLMKIREELGLSKPYFGLHLSLGYITEQNFKHSNYIHELIKKGFIN